VFAFARSFVSRNCFRFVLYVENDDVEMKNMDNCRFQMTKYYGFLLALFICIIQIYHELCYPNTNSM
jgi:hypothetical protein